MKDDKNIWLLQFWSTEDRKYRLHLIPFHLTPKGKYVNKMPNTVSGRQRLYDKWNLLMFENEINKCIDYSFPYRYETSLKKSDCEYIQTMMKLYEGILGIELGKTYIQRSDTKNYASFSKDEIENCFMKLL